MILDLMTGETYGAILYRDADTVVFWTAGRESQVSARTMENDAVMVWTHEDGELAGGELAQIDRFQWLPSPEDDANDQAAEPRRVQLATYAAANGGQIAEDRTPQPPSLGQRALALFRRSPSLDT